MRSMDVMGMLLPKEKLTRVKIYLTLILASQTMACSEFRKETITEQAPQARTLSGSEAKFTLVATDIPHQYQVQVTWPTDIDQVSIEDSGKVIFTASSGSQYAVSLKDNTRFNLRVFSHEGPQPVLIGSFSGATPKDVSFSGSVELANDQEIQANRVFFINEPRLITNGYRLKITADQLIASDAQIESFRENTKAGILKSGRSGGLVQIKAREAEGHMRITLRGEHGGDGQNALPWESRAADGGGGREGAHECAKLPGIGGPLKCACTRNPENGGDGAAGAPGRPGLPAGAGGNSGQLLVEISDPSEFVIEPFLEFGVAGTPGIGGPGQQGGYGGPGGNPTSRECPNANSGGNGATGAKGPDAAPSPNGNIEPLCISIGQGEGQCKI